MPKINNSLFDLEKKISPKSSKSGKKIHPKTAQKQRLKQLKAVETISCDDNQPITIGEEVSAMPIDSNEPIELKYDNQEESYVPIAMSYGFSSAPDVKSETEAFEVESFAWHDEDEEESNAQAFDWDEEKQESSENEHQPQPLDFNDDKEETKALSFDADIHKVEAEILPPVEETASEAFSEDDFMADLQAIIQGEKVYDKSSQKAVSLSNTENSNPTPPTAPEESQTIEENTNPHNVFDKMAKHMAVNQVSSPFQVEKSDNIFDQLGESMNYANSFDLGSISLQKTFDEFDALLDKEEAKKQTYSQKNQESVSNTLALNDEELAEDLALMNQEYPQPSVESQTSENHQDEVVVDEQNVNEQNIEDKDKVDDTQSKSS